jgi:hypothetical protein
MILGGTSTSNKSCCLGADMTLLRPKLRKQLALRKYGHIIIDPAYRVLGNHDTRQAGAAAERCGSDARDAVGMVIERP